MERALWDVPLLSTYCVRAWTFCTYWLHWIFTMILWRGAGIAAYSVEPGLELGSAKPQRECLMTSLLPCVGWGECPRKTRWWQSRTGDNSCAGVGNPLLYLGFHKCWAGGRQGIWEGAGQEHTGERDQEQTLKDLDTCLEVWAQTFWCLRTFMGLTGMWPGKTYILGQKKPTTPSGGI